MKLIYSVLQATSTLNQMALIKMLLEEKGWQHDYRNCVSVWDLRDEKNNAFLWFFLATIAHMGDTIVPYVFCTKPKAVYVTVEGIPNKTTIADTNMDKIDFITVSEYARMCLQHANLKVKDVVHHGVDWEKCNKLRANSEKMRKHWNKEFLGKVVFLYVGRLDPRKGLDRLSKAVMILNQTYKDKYVLLMHVNTMPQELTMVSNVLQVGTFGTLNYEDVLTMMGACDYGLFPSVCEGFGLPVLEHNAMARPVVHAWFPPLSEFSSQDFNFVFGYQQESLVDQSHYQSWIFHEYRPELLAEMMAQAIDFKNEEKEQYEEFCAKAAEHSKNWDYHKVYSRLLGHLGIS